MIYTFTNNDAKVCFGEMGRRYMKHFIIPFKVREHILTVLYNKGKSEELPAKPIHKKYEEKYEDLAYNSFQGHLAWLEDEGLILTRIVTHPYRLKKISLTKLGYFVCVHLDWLLDNNNSEK